MTGSVITGKAKVFSVPLVLLASPTSGEPGSSAGMPAPSKSLRVQSFALPVFAPLAMRDAPPTVRLPPDRLTGRITSA